MTGIEGTIITLSNGDMGRITRRGVVSGIVHAEIVWASHSSHLAVGQIYPCYFDG